MMSPVASSDAPADQDVFREGLTKVLALNPQFAPAYVQLARLWLRRNDLKAAFGVSRKAEELEPMRAGYHLQSGQILRRMSRGAEAATFARFVAQRWPGADHDEAVELWNAVPAEQRPAGEAPAVIVLKDTRSVEGTVKSATCSAPDHKFSLVLDHGGELLTFHSKGPFAAGFSDTIWYGEDHFTFCHHLEGMRAVVLFRPSSDASYAGDLAEMEVRDDIPEAPQKSTASAKP